jgi:Cof subfamily protein (haloacid dehalogenase superfamily)
MVCLDIDGTLLNSKHKITNRTKEIFKDIVSKEQILVVLVSARMPSSIFIIANELNLINNPIICYNGGLIIDENKRIIYREYISLLNTKKIYSFAQMIGLHISLYKDDMWYVSKIDKYVDEENQITRIVPIVKSYDCLFKAWESENSGPNKILCISNQKNIEILKTHLVESDLSKDLNISKSKPTYLEIMPLNVSKQCAINLLCLKYNIKRSEVFAIGDNFNDIEMIKFAGFGVAMGNAPEKVKKCADFVTYTNDEDGVAYAIEKFIL